MKYHSRGFVIPKIGNISNAVTSDNRVNSIKKKRNVQPLSLETAVKQQVAVNNISRQDISRNGSNVICELHSSKEPNLRLSDNRNIRTTLGFNTGLTEDLSKNPIFCIPNIKQNEKKPIKSTSLNYVDATDPELWAIVFLSLGLLVGVVSLLLPNRFLVMAALLLLLIGVSCAALCEGDFYYSSTKILAIISAVILVLWGGANASMFDF